MGEKEGCQGRLEAVTIECMLGRRLLAG